MINKDNIWVSVIMPAFNAEKYIEQAIKSVLDQTYSNLELIVINDCSSDKTEEIIDKFVLQDKRVKKYNNSSNLGVSKTRNFGISIAEHDLIAFLDSDDIWKSNKLQKQIEIINNNSDFNLVFTGSQFINQDGEKLDYILNVPEKISYKELLKQNVISCSSVLAQKSLFDEIKMPSDDMHEDFATWLSILKKYDYAYGINEPLLIYRISSNSKSSNKIKAAKMTYKVYKYIGLNIFERLYYFTQYSIRSLTKYSNINKRKENN